MKLNRQIDRSSVDPSVLKLIPMVSHWIGSWKVAINRRPHTQEDLASHYDTASESWSWTARRFQLETVYRMPLLTCGATTGLTDVRPDALVLDCGIGTGSLSITLNNILPDTIAYHGIDVSSEMLATAHVLEHLPESQWGLTEMIHVLKPGGVLFVCMTRRTDFGTFIQLRWRTWLVTEQQGITWLHDCQLNNIGFQPISLGSCVGQASMAFWPQKPAEDFGRSQIEFSAPHKEGAP